MKTIVRTALLALLGLGCASGFAAALEDRFANAGGLKIRYIDVGQGEPIVLLHVS